MRPSVARGRRASPRRAARRASRAPTRAAPRRFYVLRIGPATVTSVTSCRARSGEEQRVQQHRRRREAARRWRHRSEEENAHHRSRTAELDRRCEAPQGGAIRIPEGRNSDRRCEAPQGGAIRIPERRNSDRRCEAPPGEGVSRLSPEAARFPEQSRRVRGVRERREGPSRAPGRAQPAARSAYESERA